LAKWIATAVLVALLCGCGSDRHQTESAAAAATPTPEALVPAQSNEDVEEEYHQPPKPASADLGETITLTATAIGVRLRVTPTAVLDSAGPGGKYVAVKLRLKSTGIAIYESELRNVVMRFSNGKRVATAFGVKASCSNGFQRHIRLDVGLRTRGCVLFRRPAGAEPRTMRLALGEIPPREGGLWRLR
jgi:hypothetical protein